MNQEINLKTLLLTWQLGHDGSVDKKDLAEGKYSKHFNQSSFPINIRADTCKFKFPVEKKKSGKMKIPT